MSKVIVKCGSAFRTTLTAPKYEKKKIIMKCENNLFRDEQFPKTNYSKLCAAPARPTPSQRSQPPDKNNNNLSIFFFLHSRGNKANVGFPWNVIHSVWHFCRVRCCCCRRRQKVAARQVCADAACVRKSRCEWRLHKIWFSVNLWRMATRNPISLQRHHNIHNVVKLKCIKVEFIFH